MFMDHATHLPLATLSEEEELFRTMVREFAEEQVKPHVMEMDRAAKIPQELITQLFDLGVMGIEIPASYGGAGSSFFMSILAIEEFARVDPAVATCVDVQNTLVNNALVRWLNPDQKAQFFPRLATDTVGAYSLSESGSGSDAFAMQTRRPAGWRHLCAERPKDVDHQRRRSRGVSCSLPMPTRTRAIRA